MAAEIDWTVDEEKGVDRRELFSDEEWEIEEIFVAQLKYAANYIHHLVTSHRHFTDDCGDYLFAALDLSLQLQGVRMDGDSEQMRLFLLELAETTDQEGWLSMKVYDEHACDGVSAELDAWLRVHAWSNDPTVTERIQKGDWD